MTRAAWSDSEGVAPSRAESAWFVPKSRPMDVWRPRVHTNRWMSALVGLIPCLAQAFCERSPDASVCHVEMTRQSLGFLRPLVLKTITDHVNDVDNVAWLDYRSADHFDDCNFNGGTQRINQRYSLIAHLRPVNTGRPDQNFVFLAMRNWASILHAAQDFYAHSNWIELGFTDPVRQLFDVRRGPWREFTGEWEVAREDVRTTQGLAPPGFRVLSSSTARVPRLADALGNRYRVLLSGENSNPTEDCPSVRESDSNVDDLGIHHDTLNKDDIGRRGHLDAVRMAKGQSRHEWCRLLHLTFADVGLAHVAVPLGLLVSPSSNPHPNGTVCGQRSAGPLWVTVSARGIAVSNARENDATQRLNFVLTAFTEDLRRSTRSETNNVSVGADGRVAVRSVPSPVGLCLHGDERLAVTLQGWQDQAGSLVGQLDEDDRVLSGATRAIGAIGSTVTGPGKVIIQASPDNERQSAIGLSAVFEISVSRAVCPTSQQPVGQ